GCFGTIVAPTGVGKTMIGLMAIDEFYPCKILVVVPTQILQKEWVENIKKIVPRTKNDIQLVSSGNKPDGKSITVAVVNSIRFQEWESDLLIPDEFHRYGSKCNFTYIERGRFKKILGLTATVERLDGKHKELLAVAPQIVDLTPSSAKSMGIINKYKIVNVGVDLTSFERVRYNKASDIIRDLFPRFGYSIHNVKLALKSEGWRDASKVMEMFQMRKRILAEATGKRIKTVELVRKHTRDKVIIFSESINVSSDLARRISENGIDMPVYMTHSGMKKKDRIKNFDGFKTCHNGVLITVRALDEGINVPDANVAIVVSGSSVVRQTVQRLGRVLRVQKNPSILYQLYVPGSKDEDWLDKRTEGIIYGAESVKHVR
ncbi:MAG: hypothetical protein DRZ76_02770, partial [Candidatus Nealsonbacteria bacterium]